jgi:uncharacterized membrane protein YqaE (UPF0057 family)
MSIIPPVRVFVALGIQQAMTMSRIIVTMACPTLQYFPTISPERHGFRKKKLLNIKCVF